MDKYELGSNLFERIRKIILHHQEWSERQYGEYVIRDTWPVAMDIMIAVDAYVKEISTPTEE